jgi:glutathione S-transferase
MSSLTVWGRRNSGNTLKVLWLLDELRLPYDLVLAGAGHQPVPQALNPNGLVPVLVEGDGWALWESNTIVRHLVRTHARHTAWWPADARALARAERWMDWQQSQLKPVMSRIFKTVKATGQADGAEVGTLRADGARLWFIVAQVLQHSGPFLGSAAPDLGDVALGMHLHRWLALSTDVEPALRHWHAALMARPAYARHADGMRIGL